METNIDSLGVGKALELFPDQIKTAWSEASAFDLPKFQGTNILVSGMGGSSNAAKILTGLYPIQIHNDYDLPSWVTKDTLVVANSYSGNTEETLSTVPAAKSLGATVIGVTTGGKLGEMIKSGEIKGVIVDGTKTNSTGFPKTGLGVSFGALAGTLSKMGAVNISQEDLTSALDNLVEVRKSWNPKGLAESLRDSFPILLGAKPLVGSVSAGRNAMCEIGRTFTQYYDFPELNHVLIEATMKPAEAKTKNKYLFFESSYLHDRVKLRYKITKEIFDEQGLTYLSYELKGASPLCQALEIPHLCSWIGYHLSIMDNSDPGPEPWIQELKKALSVV